jgi:hypothetical protein
MDSDCGKNGDIVDSLDEQLFALFFKVLRVFCPSNSPTNLLRRSSFLLFLPQMDLPLSTPFEAFAFSSDAQLLPLLPPTLHRHLLLLLLLLHLLHYPSKTNRKDSKRPITCLSMTSCVPAKPCSIMLSPQKNAASFPAPSFQEHCFPGTEDKRWRGVSSTRHTPCHRRSRTERMQIRHRFVSSAHLRLTEFAFDHQEKRERRLSPSPSRATTKITLSRTFSPSQGKGALQPPRQPKKPRAASRSPERHTRRPPPELMMPAATIASQEATSNLGWSVQRRLEVSGRTEPFNETR